MLGQCVQEKDHNQRMPRRGSDGITAVGSKLRAVKIGSCDTGYECHRKETMRTVSFSASAADCHTDRQDHIPLSLICIEPIQLLVKFCRVAIMTFRAVLFAFKTAGFFRYWIPGCPFVQTP